MADEKTFTQAELDEIVKERVAREKKKFGVLQDAHDTIQTELEQAQKDLKEAQDTAAELPALKRAQLVTEVATAKEVPTHLANRLVGDTKEELEADADKLLADLELVTPQSKKGVPLTPLGGGEPKPGTARQRIAKSMREQNSSRT